MSTAAGRAVAVCGAKGGTGASTTALELARAAGGLLVDMAFGFDDAASRLGCSPRRTLADLVPLSGELGSDAVRSVASPHPGGMSLIAGPDATAESLPALMTLALPLTGQHTKSAPRSPSRLRMAADSSTAMVEQSTTTSALSPMRKASEDVEIKVVKVITKSTRAG